MQVICDSCEHTKFKQTYSNRRKVLNKEFNIHIASKYYVLTCGNCGTKKELLIFNNRFCYKWGTPYDMVQSYKNEWDNLSKNI